MKIFTEHWNTFFDWLPAWSLLSPESREFFAVEIPNDLRIPKPSSDSSCVDELKTVGFIKGDVPRLPSEIRPFRKAIRAMHRNRLFDAEHPTMRGFCEGCLTRNEAQSMLDYHDYHANPWRSVEVLASDESWLRGFLDSRLGAEWEQERTNQARDAWLAKVATVELLKKWIRRCLEGNNPIAVEEILSDHRQDPDTVSDALTAGVRYLLFFPALRSGSLDPVVGIWPDVHRRLSRTLPDAPVLAASPPDVEVFATPYLLHDMTMALVNSAPDGLRLRRSGGGLFKREVDKLTALLSPIRNDLGLSTDGGHRVYEACAWLDAMGLFRVKGEHGKEPALIATPAGKEWLGSSIESRLQRMLDTLRKAYQDRAKSFMGYGGAHLRFVSHEVNTGGWGYDKDLDPQRHLAEAFVHCKTGQWSGLEPFLDWVAETANPLLRNTGGKRSHYGRFIRQTAAEKEATWRRYVHYFVIDRLIPLGGAHVCVDASGKVHFSLTPAGAYLLGRTDAYEYAVQEPAGQVLVQPNLEVVFTAPAPAAESELAQCAERIGHGVGTLFRITRQSVHAAFDYGIEGADILERLRQHTHKALPANVVTQITDWANAYRRVSFRRMLVIRCPDPETAKHVQSIFPRLTRPITETLLEVTNQKSLKDIKKKLKKNGLGVE